MRRLQRLVVVLLALLLSAPGGPLFAGDGAASPVAAWTAGEACPDCGDCPPGQMVRSGCVSMCAFTPAERIAAIAPVAAGTQPHAPLDDLGLDGLRPRPEPTPPRLRA